MSPRSDNPAANGEPLSITERELLSRLGWFTKVRWGMGLLAMAMLLISWYVLGVRFRLDGRADLAPACCVIGLLFVYNAAFTGLFHLARARRQIRRPNIVAMVLGQIVCDLAAVSASVHYTGGVQNLFIILLLLPLVIAAEFLSRRLAFAVACGAAAAIHVLAWGEQRGLFAHYQADWPGAPASGYANLHRDVLFVTEITVAMTLAIFSLTLIASNVAGRLRRREDQLGEANKRLRAADETKGFFMRKASHEMRAPLAAICSILDALGEDTALDDQKRQLLHRARQRAGGLIDLVEDLRRYSRIRDGASILRPVRVNLGEIVAGTIDLFRQQADRSGVQLISRVDAVNLLGDEELLRELATNLIANAIQYTPSGGKIEVTLTSHGAQAVLQVADTGIGIAPEDAGRLFEEFYRTSRAKEFFPEGTGLGLAICRRIVELHGGRIEAQPASAAGTVFTARLPLNLA